MQIGYVILVLAAVGSTAEGYCYSTTLYAKTYSQYQAVSASYYAYCSISIRPNYQYSSSSYYLEISWSSSHFDVKGNMPDCKEDYVEVYLTSSERSIGRFCSNNAGKPFTMYSRDSYAKIIYRTNGYANGKGFTFYYRLKSKASWHLGSYPTSTSCYNTFNSAESGVIYSTGWPRGYQSSYSSCNYKIEKSYQYMGTVVVFMDINMYPYGYPSDCAQLYASNYTYYYTNTISSKLCYTNNMKRYATYGSYLKISFDRTNGPGYSSYRGFIAGYLMFKTPSTITDQTHTSSSQSSSNGVAIALSVIIPGVIVFVVIVSAVIYNKKKRRNTATTASSYQTQTTGTVPTNPQAAPQPTNQTAASVPYTGAAFTTPQYVYPTASVYSGGYLAGSYAGSYSSPYPTASYNAMGNASQQISFTVAASNTTVPPGAMQPSPLTGDQQQTVGTTYYTSGSSAGANGEYPPPVPPVETSPNVPPPSYSTIVSS